MFRGREGLKYELASMGGQPIITSQDKISLVFKTRKSSALLYYNGKLSLLKVFTTIQSYWACKSMFSNNISWSRLAGRNRVWVKHEAQNTNTSHTYSLYIVGSWIVSKPQGSELRTQSFVNQIMMGFTYFQSFQGQRDFNILIFKQCSVAKLPQPHFKELNRTASEVLVGKTRIHH